MVEMERPFPGGTGAFFERAMGFCRVCGSGCRGRATRHGELVVASQLGHNARNAVERTTILLLRMAYEVDT